MAKKLYHIGIDTIKQFISTNYSNINSNIKDSQKFELSKNFGRSYYEISINDFFLKYKIQKDILYAIKVLNIFKSYKFIFKLYRYLNLERFENLDSLSLMNENSIKDYKKSIFYSFVYFLFTNIDDNKITISQKLFSEYFLHYISSINNSSLIHIDYKNLTLGIIKGKNIVIKESFKIDEQSKTAIFKIIINNEEKIILNGSSIKTLRKKAYKQTFLYLIDNDTLDNKTARISEAYEKFDELKI